jgi:agmatine deiminase
MNRFYFFFLLLICYSMGTYAQTTYTMPEETALHEGTWIQWPHNNLYGPWYQGDVEPTFVAMTKALQSGENVHIIAYDSTELDHILSVLDTEGVPMTNLDFFVFPNDDVWSRDNGPMFVYDENNQLHILDWGFNGWGGDTPYSKCDKIPELTSEAIGIPRIDLSAMVLEGGAIEHDGRGTMMATRSSITHPSRNPNLSETEIEQYLTTYMGITKFIWLDGVYGVEITDMHIDGFVKFANDSTIVTMNNADLIYWYVTPNEIDLIYNATNVDDEAFEIVKLPLTQNDVVTTYGYNLGYKGSYVNYYIGNEVVLVPTYNDPNDAEAIAILEDVHPDRTIIGVDVRNIYEYGGMVHCLTQQQPIDLNPTGALELDPASFDLQQNMPNPFSEQTVIGFSAPEGADVQLEVYDMQGRLIQRLFPAVGQQVFELKASGFQDGVYFYRLILDGQVSKSRKMIFTGK